MTSRSLRSSCFDIIKAIYGFTDIEIEILACIHYYGQTDIKGLTNIIAKDRSTISHSIQRLVTVGVLKKKEEYLKEGEYKYVYEAISIAEMKNKLRKVIDEIFVNMQKRISELSEEKCKEIFEKTVKEYQKR